LPFLGAAGSKGVGNGPDFFFWNIKTASAIAIINPKMMAIFIYRFLLFYFSPRKRLLFGAEARFFWVFFAVVAWRLVGEGKATHARLDAEDVVVDGEHALLESTHARLEHNLDLCVINAREVASASWLVLLWLKSERVAVDTWVRVAGVVVEWLDQIEVLAWLGCEAILAVKDKLEVGKGTNLNAGSEPGCGVGECNAILGPVHIGEGS